MKKIMDIDKSLRPRERLKNEGYEVLSDEELLAILISTGSQGKNAIELSKDILDKFSSDELISITVEELCEIEGIKLAKASKIIAGIQFGRRLSERILNKEIVKIKSSNDVYKLMKNKFLDTKKEHFYAILLDTKNVIISKELISTGDLNSSIVNPRECFVVAVRKSAKSVIFVHNHPSGNSNPSKSDMLTTNRLIDAGKILDIEVLDHIIIGLDEYYSFREENFI
ncbi:DNA repair protein RadC [Anaerococcus sp. AGMB00486]|uniref:DNA repair protein RadC n=2 Tax=Anaerococcus TaxID=165779 RepID=A0ABX2N907_9FIRM|nr:MULTISPECIES: DNA repair protein RadC [Anaerococcus]MDY3006216.1 DNA repair protein RadC [Anaerococcus porci]MSS77188.1 JAB domain-containing protein [Anaerococcus porci]NVF11007.1 DNA repair protein RadC [Anaerococcus faecalis]